MKFKKIILTTIILSVLFFITGCGKKEFTVKFDSNGGTTIEDVVVKKNETVTKPVDPYKEDYVFVRWELDGAEFDFSTKIKKDITLVATYREISEEAYTVSFQDGLETTTQRVEENDVVRKPADPIKEGYKFLYWEHNGEEFDFDTKITKNIVLVAKWEKEDEPVDASGKLTIRFDSRGGTKVSNQVINKGSRISKPKNPTRDGYTFVGWKNGSSFWNFNWTTNISLTLRAEWLKVEEKEEPKEKDPVYEVDSRSFQIGSPQVEVVVKKDGKKVKAKEVYTSKDVLLGNNNNEFDIILVNKNEFNKIAKVKLADGTIVNVQK